MPESNMLFLIHQILQHCMYLYNWKISTFWKVYKIPKVLVWILEFPFLNMNNQDCFPCEYAIKVCIFCQLERKVHDLENASVLAAINFPSNQSWKTPYSRAP